MQQSSKITALYLRISREDEKEGDSNSIINQRATLLNYAERNKFENVQVFSDDGISGVTLNRNAFKELLALVEQDEVSTVIVKDMSRIGRNYLEVGELTEIFFPQHNVRLIAINDGVDSQFGEDDFTPFRNLINEFYSKDISRKRRSTNKILDKQGKPIGQPIYGYKWDTDSQYWEVDNEAAEVIQNIFRLRLEGNSTDRIAKHLRGKQIDIPTVYLAKKGLRKAQNKLERGSCFWNVNTVSNILKNQKYCGDVINFQTFSRSYKLKERLKNPKEEWSIHENIHEAIIDRDTFEQVQKTFRKTKMRSPKDVPKHMLAGFLVCSDCGKNLHYKLTYPNNDNHYFSCGNNRASKKLCSKTHHIRVDMVEKLLLIEINKVIRFANKHTGNFIASVLNEQTLLSMKMQADNKKQLAKLLKREKELDKLFANMYEDKVLGSLSENQFEKLSLKFQLEQAEVAEQIEKLELIVAQELKNEVSIDKFLKLTEKPERIDRLTIETLHDFIDYIVVHHREKRTHCDNQKVDIYFNHIGKIDIPTLTTTCATEGRKADKTTKVALSA